MDRDGSGAIRGRDQGVRRVVWAEPRRPSNVGEDAARKFRRDCVQPRRPADARSVFAGRRAFSCGTTGTTQTPPSRRRNSRTRAERHFRSRSARMAVTLSSRERRRRPADVGDKGWRGGFPSATARRAARAQGSCVGDRRQSGREPHRIGLDRRIDHFLEPTVGLSRTAERRKPVDEPAAEDPSLCSTRHRIACRFRPRRMRSKPARPGCRGCRGRQARGVQQSRVRPSRWTATSFPSDIASVKLAVDRLVVVTQVGSQIGVAVLRQPSRVGRLRQRSSSLRPRTAPHAA